MSAAWRSEEHDLYPLGTRSRPGKGRQVFSEAGCGLCKTTFSSSFRSDPQTGLRLCNSCHCKAYRLKRKACGLPTRGGSRDSDRAASRPRVRSRTAVDCSLPPLSLAPSPEIVQVPHQFAMLEHWTEFDAFTAATPPLASARRAQLDAAYSPPLPALADANLVLEQQQQTATQAPRQSVLTDMQRRVFEGTCSGPHDVTLAMHCARRAQQATPACPQRVVLAVLPQLQLQLHEDPAGMLHTMSCLVEAVVPSLSHEEHTVDSEEGEEQQHVLAVVPAVEVAVRLTMFASAGAVACWHEGPPEPSLSLGFSPITRAPIWSSGPEGFSVHFPHPFCPQIDLLAAIHQHVAALGTGVLQQATVSLDGQGGWPTSMGQPPALTSEGASMPAQEPAAAYPAAALGAANQLSQQFFVAAEQQAPPMGLAQQLLRQSLPQQQLSFGPLSTEQLFSVGLMHSDTGFSLFDL